MAGPLRRTTFRERQLRRDGGPYGTPPPRNESLTYDHLVQQQNEDISGADGLPGKLRVLNKQLDLSNSNDDMVTFNVETREWTQWEL